jgi:hypothetical protein
MMGTNTNRMRRAMFMAAVVLGSCWGMMAVHELGHVLGAWATGGVVRHVELRPWRISRTDVMPNPSPLIVAWAGPIVGVIVPLVMWLLGRKFATKATKLLRFFAGFCWIANGAYLAFGSIGGVGDAGDLLRHGAAAWQLWLFGAVCVPAGLWLWHGLGRATANARL